MPLAPMGCSVQFHIKPNRRKTWGEHSSNGWYLTTSPDHYRCHYIFVKATRSKRISDTVFFKHKQITQPTLTTEDLIIKAIQDLTNVIRGNNKPGNKPGNNSQIEAIKQLTTALQPRNQLPLGKASNNAPPRVQTDASPRVQIIAPPRVQLNVEANEDIQFDANETPQSIVEPPKLIVKSPTKQTPESESIADRVKKRLRNTQVSSIAERVIQRRRESANPVLDHDTGKLLEYRQLLKDPKHKERWTTAGANEFGR